jgi:mannose-6-phosphate isomerase-like protein (cupin superfamily)
MRRRPPLNTVLILLLAAFTSSAQDTKMSNQVAEDDKQFLLTYPNLDNSDGEVVLTNDHVVLQRLVVPAGEWEGIHSHPGNQIYVHIKGGEWSGRIGGKSDYSGSVDEDGAVGWMDAIPLSAGHESGNTGDTPIDLIYVTLKSNASIAPEVEHLPQIYPNIPLELLLENDRMIVQRVRVEPGQWTGIHSHPGNQVYIHIKGGIWSERRDGVQSPPSPFSKAGSVGWMDAIDLSAGHEFGNTGDTTIDLVLVTLK